MATLSQRTFSSGEISPSLYARVDIVKYVTGLRTCKNNIILRYGGAANRSGTKFICEVSDSTVDIRLIPFVFNTSQTYLLEFGNLYMRVIKDGVLQTEASKSITGLTQADPAVMTVTSHGYSNGDEVSITDVGGMVEVNNRNFKVANVTTHTFELQEMDGTDLDSTGYTAYTSGGNSAKVYELTTVYTSSQVGDLKYVQSADIITIVHPSHAPSELSRAGDISWSFSTIQYIPDITHPLAINATVGAAGTETYEYTVTSIDEETGEESLIGTTTDTIYNITGITQADPCVVTVSATHTNSIDDVINIINVVGMTEINDRRYIITAVTATTMTLDLDSSDYNAWSSGGNVYRCNFSLGAAAVPTASAPHTVTWTEIADAVEYNIYRRLNGVFGLVGIASGGVFLDEGLITPDTTTTPPASRVPFLGANNYPSTVTFIQQRLCFANTNNDTEKIWMSKTGNFKNFTTTTPLQADDAVTFKMAGRQVNAVKALLDLGSLVIMTTGGESEAAGNEAGVITPTSVNTRQFTYNGSGDLQPIIIDGAAIYQQARGSIIRDLDQEFKGSDLTIFAAHLFDQFTLVDWAFQQIPHSILWVVRSDGSLLGMTFVKNQQVLAWHQHDLGGSVERVSVIPESNEDAVYVTVKRTVNAKTVRYIEKISTRQIDDIADATFMDSHATYDGRNTGATTMTLSGGTDWTYLEDLTLTASTSYFVAGDVGNAIHIKSGDIVIRCTIKSYTSGTVVTVNPHKTVPVAMRSTAFTTWTKAVDEVAGLWHLEGEDVSVFADGFVTANPNNDSYDTITVTSGKVTLDKPYGVIHVGLPYISDVETLDIDTNQGETIVDKEKNVSRVSMFVEDTRGVWVGPKPPSDDTVDPLEDLTEVKIRNNEDYDSPVSLTTDVIDVNIKPEWNSNGRVFIRQVDPIPMTLLSINPAGKFPFR